MTSPMRLISPCPQELRAEALEVLYRRLPANLRPQLVANALSEAEAGRIDGPIQEQGIPTCHEGLRCGGEQLARLQVEDVPVLTRDRKAAQLTVLLRLLSSLNGTLGQPAQPR